MNYISASKANQSFSKLLKRAEAGEEIIITKRGVPVARLKPEESLENKHERSESHKRLMNSLRKGFNLGGKPFSRDEIYNR